jgi:hypothetical protein
MDLLGRKVGMNKGKPFMGFLGRIKACVDQAKQTAGLEALAARVEAVYNKYTEVVSAIAQAAMSDKVLNAFAQSHPLLMVTGDLTMAWMLLWRAQAAQTAIAGGAKKKDLSFYEGQVKTCEFFVNNTLFVTEGRLNAIKNMNSAVNDMSEDAFGSK